MDIRQTWFTRIPGDTACKRDAAESDRSGICAIPGSNQLHMFTGRPSACKRKSLPFRSTPSLAHENSAREGPKFEPCDIVTVGIVLQRVRGDHFMNLLHCLVFNYCCLV